MAIAEAAEPFLEERNRKEERFRAMTKKLKQRLKSLADQIYTDDRFPIQTANRIIDTLTSLSNYKCSMELNIDIVRETVPAQRYPNELLCPYSGKPMFHPVVIASGKTFECSAVEDWLAEGCPTCPVTGVVLEHTYITPNNLVKEIMKHYCKENGIKYPGEKKSKQKDELKKISTHYLNRLLQGLEGSGSNIYDVAKLLRRMTNKYEGFRTLFHSSDVIQRILIPLGQLTDSSTEGSAPIHEDLITTMYNLSTHPDCKRLIVLYPTAIQLLMESLTCGSIGARLSAAGALFLLSTAEKDINASISKKILGQAGALKPLIEVLAEGHPLTMKVAADAILSLCEEEDNKDIAISKGIVKVIVKKLRNCVLVDELLALLLMLSTRRQARDQMWNENALSVIEDLFDVVTTCRSTKNCLEIVKAFHSHLHERRIEEENRERERKAAEEAIKEQKSLQRRAKSVFTNYLTKFSECVPEPLVESSPSL